MSDNTCKRMVKRQKGKDMVDEPCGRAATHEWAGEKVCKVHYRNSNPNWPAERPTADPDQLVANYKAMRAITDKKEQAALKASLDAQIAELPDIHKRLGVLGRIADTGRLSIVLSQVDETIHQLDTRVAWAKRRIDRMTRIQQHDLEKESKKMTGFKIGLERAKILRAEVEKAIVTASRKPEPPAKPSKKELKAEAKEAAKEG